MRQTEFLTTACDPKTLTVGQLMQEAVFTCSSRADALSISRMMTQRNFGSLPVVEEDRTLVGLVSEYDLLQAMIDGRDLRKIMAVEIMSSNPVTSTENMKLEEVANLFQDRYITRVPVVRNGKLVGILARRDLLFGYMKASQYWS
jgi:CBS domain-containing protein